MYNIINIKCFYFVAHIVNACCVLHNIAIKWRIPQEDIYLEAWMNYQYHIMITMQIMQNKYEEKLLDGISSNILLCNLYVYARTIRVISTER